MIGDSTTFPTTHSRCLCRARNYGFLYPNSKRLIRLLQWLIECTPYRQPIPADPRPPIRCPDCGGVMHIVRTRITPAETDGPFANRCRRDERDHVTGTTGSGTVVFGAGEPEGRRSGPRNGADPPRRGVRHPCSWLR